jgi:hypothetical protein
MYIKTLPEEVINKDLLWDFFLWTLPRIPPKGGVVGILHISPTHNIYFKARLGNNTNNLCEHMALKLI